jgi:hypothetical protein
MNLFSVASDRRQDVLVTCPLDAGRIIIIRYECEEDVNISLSEIRIVS